MCATGNASWNVLAQAKCVKWDETLGRLQATALSNLSSHSTNRIIRITLEWFFIPENCCIEGIEEMVRKRKVLISQYISFSHQFEGRNGKKMRKRKIVTNWEQLPSCHTIPRKKNISSCHLTISLCRNEIPHFPRTKWKFSFYFLYFSRPFVQQSLYNESQNLSREKREITEEPIFII